MDKTDEYELFRSMMSDAKPLKSDRAHNDSPKPEARARFSREERRAVLEESLTGSQGGPEHPDAEEFRRAGISAAVFKKLKRGLYAVDEELDLHGLNVNEARDAINQFFREARFNHWQCVRIIHGKGKRSFQGVAVLRPRVTRWLRKNDQVLAFCSAQPRDGGTGAVYVLLAN